MSNRRKYPDSEPVDVTQYGEDNEHPRIDPSEVIRELRRSNFKGIDDYLEEFEEDDYPR